MCLVATGMRLTSLNGSFKLLSDTIIIDSIAGRAGGRGYASGGLGIRTLSQPSFDVKLVAENARVLDTEQGSVRAYATVTARGPFDRVVVDGRVGVRNGVIIVPESDNKEVISARDPAL